MPDVVLDAIGMGDVVADADVFNDELDPVVQLALYPVK